MDTKERLAPEAPVIVTRPSRKRPVALVAAVLVAVGLAVGIGASLGTEPASRQAPLAISVPAGHTQPATLIHRISMQSASEGFTVRAGHTQPATKIHRISMQNP